MKIKKVAISESIVVETTAQELIEEWGSQPREFPLETTINLMWHEAELFIVDPRTEFRYRLDISTTEFLKLIPDIERLCDALNHVMEWAEDQVKDPGYDHQGFLLDGDSPDDIFSQVVQLDQLSSIFEGKPDDLMAVTQDKHQVLYQSEEDGSFYLNERDDNYREQAMAAKDIDNLLQIIERAQDQADRDNLKLEDVIDITTLPTFGGDDPNDTRGIFSWDSDYLLVYGDFGWKLEFRHEKED